MRDLDPVAIDDADREGKREDRIGATETAETDRGFPGSGANVTAFGGSLTLVTVLTEVVPSSSVN
jgi:hypothetical protein